MIAKQDILDRAAEWQLRPEIVEKDYVLGWVLAGIAGHPETRERWIFKGGTCLKKCYFETYRFSEDLDFSLHADAAYDTESLRRVLGEVVARAGDLSGIGFPPDLVSVRGRTDKAGRATFEGKVRYRGPLVIPSTPRILFDLTRHEPVLDAVERRRPFHPYPDELPEVSEVGAYSLAELLAEKTRALYERTLPRDLYDVVNILRNHAAALDLVRTRDLLRRKCEVKGIAFPSSYALRERIAQSAELNSEWKNMLGHQLPLLPPIEGLLEGLAEALRWVDEAAAVPTVVLAGAPVGAGEELVAPPSVTLWNMGVPLEVIRFAGANRLLVEFTYNGEPRLVEPYSFRRARTGDLLLYAWERATDQIKAFNVARISGIRATETPFSPRFLVELTASGPIGIPPTAIRPPRSAWPTTSSTRTPRRRSRGFAGPTYVFQCPLCQKEFRRASNDSTLRKHKVTGGYWDCPGRRGYLVRVE